MGIWRNDWVDNGMGGFMISGSGPGSGGPAGSGVPPPNAPPAPGPVGVGPGYWTYDAWGDQLASGNFTGNDSGIGAANPSGTDHGQAVFHSAGGGMRLPGGPQTDIGS